MPKASPQRCGVCVHTYPKRVVVAPFAAHASPLFFFGRRQSGFENFDTKNEFEQLLINFTNESLQDTFNKQVFNNELKLYEEEGIDVVVSSCPDNTACLLMLSAKPKGIIPTCVRLSVR